MPIPKSTHYKTPNNFCGKNYLEQDAEEKARAAEEGEGNDEAWVLQQTVVGSYRYERNYPKGISSCLAWGGIMSAKIEDHNINELYLFLYVASKWARFREDVRLLGEHDAVSLPVELRIETTTSQKKPFR